ncbi:MAG: UDP-N-acetylmuramoyl-L-alanyl-D-glutamate--2,6-diaminopimelate ligase, partial [Sandaracinaceae bacterium]|nr:UDP-N-acetylmuramoyl-L-alanyl-D-glutamate--2,6-diaminopimelate ligase [Sandaracinaceae bacterium]
AISRFARKASEQGATHLVMEVSSHALALHRVDGITFDTVAFTNLSQDHLDFHASMEAYFQAKARLFLELGSNHQVVHMGTPWGARLASALSARAAPDLWRIASWAQGEAEISLLAYNSSAEGIWAELEVKGLKMRLTSPLVGAHNLENLLVAFAVLLALGTEPEAAAQALACAKGPPGRLEAVDGLDGVRVFVDYAHTPDALGRMLEALRPLVKGRLLVVFGCGGDRDSGKRPLMGRVAGERADIVIVTSDNPRSENPQSIVDAIVCGLKGLGIPWVEGCHLSQAHSGYFVEIDRGRAIEMAILSAQPGDIVLIAGKGHETHQIIGSTRRPFDDRLIARKAIELRKQRLAKVGR